MSKGSLEKGKDEIDHGLHGRMYGGIELHGMDTVVLKHLVKKRMRGDQAGEEARNWIMENFECLMLSSPLHG